MTKKEISKTSDIFSVTETLRGKTVFVTGSTGFLAKVYVSMLLRYHSDIKHLYLLVRDRSFETAEERVRREIYDSVAFEPVREFFGSKFDDVISEKVTVVSGDITTEHLGLEKKLAKKISNETDIFVNSAGLTNFNPNLESALEINTLSADILIAFLRLAKKPAKLLHVSTAFVAGQDESPLEVLPTPEIYPRYEDIQTPLDHRREIDDCREMIRHAEHQADDQERQSMFAEKARAKLLKHNVHPDDEISFAEEVKKQRKEWVRKRLSNAGKERANHWGWINIYTYTKSLGERIFAEDAKDIDVSIFRPTIIESSISFPVKGWNEGSNTSAPIAYLIWKGHRFFPTREVKLDLIPVDMVVGSMIAICAGLVRGAHSDVYHVGSSDRNSITGPRIIELMSLSARQLLPKETSLSPAEKFIRAQFDARGVSKSRYKRLSAPRFNKVAKGIQKFIAKVPTKELGGIGLALDVVSEQTGKLERSSGFVGKIFEIFESFIYDYDYNFRARNIEELRASMQADEHERYGGVIEDLDWREYIIECHMPGLKKYVFEDLDDKMKSTKAKGYQYKSLIDLYDASVINFPHRIAFQYQSDESIHQLWKYSDVDAHVKTVGAALEKSGFVAGGTIVICAKNSPAWATSYFGIIKSEGIAVPVDSESTALQLGNILKACSASLIVADEAVIEKLADSKSKVPVITLQQFLAGEIPKLKKIKVSSELYNEDVEQRVASLIYTSGTTGDPKGVKLSHANFAALLFNMSGTFDIDHHDGFLSVLPLHHTFEFTCGFLMPFSRGAAVTYIEELTGDELRAAMKNTRITALIGVPALWQLLDRRIQQNIDEASPATRFVFERLNGFNRELRKKTGINIGPTVFAEVHRGFGSQIRYLISGAAALPEDVLNSFYGLGFDLYEGYGLTEAAPVLTVTKPKDGIKPGTVGKALPNIEIKINDPDANGVGEVIARGESVMIGYFGNEEATEQTIKDGWLYTGDLGSLDKKGRLTIVGRSKEVIITSSGKNVYPDELDELYGKFSEILEISVVGLPVGDGSERVAALIRPDVEDDASLDEIAIAQQRIRDWIRVEGSRVPPHQKISVVKFWDDELPRTATKKVKRKEVVAIIERLNETTETASGSKDWLTKVLSTMTGVGVSKIKDASRFQDDLGFDSLMVVELAAILSERGIPTSADALVNIDNVSELRAFVNTDNRQAMIVDSSADRVEEYDVPKSISKLGKSVLYEAQMGSYRQFFNTKVYGKANIPFHNPNVIVVSNHSSHLDMGLVKYALGDFASNIRALAAADYFFKNPTRKTFFKNFTNLIPLERSGNPMKSLEPVSNALANGETILMFPEGTRAKDGKLREFRKGVGYLSVRHQVDILPLWVEGTYQSFPKGQTLPSFTSRNLKVRIGKPISISELMPKIESMSLSDQADFVAKTAHDAVQALRDLGQPKTEGDNLEAVFDALKEKFKVGEIDSEVSFYFSLGQVDTHKWTVVADAKGCEIYNGKPSGGADCVIKTSPAFFKKLVQEKYVPSFDEFMDGSIKTSSPDLLVRFQSIFRLQE